MRIPDDKVDEWFPYVEESIRKDAANLMKYENGFVIHMKHGSNVRIKGETKHDGEILSLTGWQRGQMLKKVLTRPFTLHVKKTWFNRISTFLFVQSPSSLALARVTQTPAQCSWAHAQLHPSLCAQAHTTLYLDDSQPVVVVSRASTPPPPPSEEPPPLFVSRLEV